MTPLSLAIELLDTGSLNRIPRAGEAALRSGNSTHRKRNLMADKNTVMDLLTDEIKDLYSAEKQLTKAIPKMAKGSNDAQLKKALQDHLKETEEQVTRLEKVAEV